MTEEPSSFLKHCVLPQSQSIAEPSRPHAKKYVEFDNTCHIYTKKNILKYYTTKSGAKNLPVLYF